VWRKAIKDIESSGQEITNAIALTLYPQHVKVMRVQYRFINQKLNQDFKRPVSALIRVLLIQKHNMAGCEHIAWLQSVNIKELQLCNEGRIRRVVQKMPDFITQSPSVVFFIGQKVKNIALWQLFSCNNIRWGQWDGFANLWIDNATLNSDQPIWFANSDPFKRVTPTCGAGTCHESVTYHIRWTHPSQHSIFDILHAHLFFLFTDVICIFADDFHGLEGVAERLIAWAVIGSASSLSAFVWPQIVVITSADGSSSTHNLLESEDFCFNLQQQTHESIADSFSSITLFYLLEDHLSLLTQHCQLRKTILNWAEEMWAVQAGSQSLFSAVHLQQFYKQAILHTTETVTQPFSFITMAQERNIIIEDLKNHLMTFISLDAQIKLSYDTLASHLASSLLMNVYSSDIHSELLIDPSLSFQWKK